MKPVILVIKTSMFRLKLVQIAHAVFSANIFTLIKQIFDHSAKCNELMW